MSQFSKLYIITSYNSFIVIQFMYHQIHSFEMWSLVNGTMLREMYNPYHYAILQYFYHFPSQK